MATMTILAIDPGLNNGIAILDLERRLLLATEIPVIGEGANKRLNLISFADILTQFSIRRAVVEDVAAMPKQGLTSTFRFGRAAGSFEGALAALKIPTSFVRPAIWNGTLAPGPSATKTFAHWPSRHGRIRRTVLHASATITVPRPR